MKECSFGINIEIEEAISDAIDQAREFKTTMYFKFSGITVMVRQDSNAKLILRDWLRTFLGYIDGKVGPYPNPNLTEEERAHDAQIEERRRREAEENQKRRDGVLKDALMTAPEKMTLREGTEGIWEEAIKSYVKMVIDYAQRWARLMEGRINNGYTLEACAQETSHLADKEGVSGHAYGMAVSILSKVWIYGEQLLSWHNSQFAAGERATEQGKTINPALIFITPR